MHFVLVVIISQVERNKFVHHVITLLIGVIHHILKRLMILNNIYTYLGNACNHQRTLEFVRSGYNMELLRKLENN